MSQEYTKKFLWLSDIHLDPYYGTANAGGSRGADCYSSDAPSHGQLGCDAPVELLKETLLQAASDAVDDDYFVILTGDLCRHGTDQLEEPGPETQAILSNVSLLLHETLGEISVIPSLGNNDVTPDYYLDVSDPTELLSMVTNGLESLLESDLERNTFLKGGYLARNVSDTLTVVSLNTILYSTSHIPIDDDLVDDPLGQFEWLENQLNLACGRGRFVYLVGHIPPAMGSYRHSQLWHAPYLEKYYSILQRTAPCITGQLFGHLHADEFRWIQPSLTFNFEDDTGLSYPLWLASSISPIYGSNPSYRWVSYETELASGILDFETHYMNLLDDEGNELQWKKGPSFRESYNIDNLDVGSMQSLLQGLNQSITEPDAPLWKALLNRQHVFVSGDEDLACRDVACRRAWICTLTTITSDNYASCLAAAGANPLEVVLARSTFKERIIFGAGLAVMIAVGVCVCICQSCRRCIRRRHYKEQIPDEEDGIVLDQGLQAKNSDRTATAHSSSSLEENYRDADQQSGMPEIA